jgi:hypothetical protein
MELKTEIDQVKAKSTDNPVLYTAAGWVAGIYQPSPDKFYQGVLVTQDGQAIRCRTALALTKSTQTQASWLCGTARLFP